MLESERTWQEALCALQALTRTPGPHQRWRVEGLRGGARPLFLSRFLSNGPRPSLIIVPDAKEAERLAGDLRFFCDEPEGRPPFARRVHYLPAWDVVPFEDLSPPADVVAARIEGLYHLRQTRDPIILTTPDALLQRVPPVSAFAGQYLYLVERDTVDRDRIVARLEAWGYRHLGLVEDRGEFSVRGGIIDVFPPAHSKPIRVNLNGDVIDTLHEFDPVTQRLRERQAELLLLPVREFNLTSEQRAGVRRAVEARALEIEIGRDERSLILEGLASGPLFPGVEFCLPYFHSALDTVFDYLPADTLVWIDDSAGVEMAAERSAAEIERRAAQRAAQHRFFPPPERLYLSLREWRAALAERPQIALEPLEMLGGGTGGGACAVRSFTVGDLRAKRLRSRQEISFAPVAERVREWQAEGNRVFFVASSEPQCQRLARLLTAHELPVTTPSDPFVRLLEQPSNSLRVVRGELSEGFRLPDELLVVVTERDVFGEARRRAARSVSVAQLLRSLGELKPDDYVVHIDHGVGIYRGLRHLQVAGTEGDYLQLEYAGGDRLYLPADRINLVQKYVGADGEVPAIDKLGGASWERVKKKTRESVLAMAKELLAVYAAREVHERGHRREPDMYFREFEAAFPFEETPDQHQAVEDVLGDLQRPKPMDRLICGDVGYGKTEVAVRATFVTAMDGEQVAVLVPTTVLAQQHLDTFRRRFDGYPVRVEMLSRFLSPAQARAVIRGLDQGTVDVVIGTHRLLQPDVTFKRLGLLVIDEEHRFGVRHKERIKEMRQLVDVLTLTATPIPRTLHMSLMGIRDLSVIETPPVDRLAIRTYVTSYDDDIIREAVLRELGRSGQVFFVHNRVENIDLMARHLRALIPEAVVAVAHGQMHERELEKVMRSFITRGTNLLVCSAIIESGLDIPNANTIIINHADQFGLAQLYQLRGRVGRSHERAYAFLLIPGEHRISREAQKRLRVLQELDDLGGGFRLAAHDLEIRGAGNLLGRQQSGHIAAVGFDLYTRMMEEAVHELRGDRRRVEVEPEIQLGIPAYIPESYISDENQRLAFYRRLAAINDRGDLDAIAMELRERYGPTPPLVDTFLRLMELRRSLRDSMVVHTSMRNGFVTVQFHPDAPVEVDRLVAIVHSQRDRFRLGADYQVSFTPRHTDWDGLVEEIQAVLRELRGTAAMAPPPPTLTGVPANGH